jgi:hypothetical protein
MHDTFAHGNMSIHTVGGTLVLVGGRSGCVARRDAFGLGKSAHYFF